MMAALGADVEARLGVFLEDGRLALRAADEVPFGHAALGSSNFFRHRTPNLCGGIIPYLTRLCGPGQDNNHASDRAATPGSVLPSSNSSDAPPPVEQWVTFSSAPHWAAAVAVSPPPITVTAPRCVAATTASMIAWVPAANRSHSNRPSGPFHTIVLARAITWVNSRIDSGPQSSPCQPAGMPSFAVTIRVFASAAKRSAITKSVGRCNGTLRSCALRAALSTCAA